MWMLFYFGLVSRNLHKLVPRSWTNQTLVGRILGYEQKAIRTNCKFLPGQTWNNYKIVHWTKYQSYTLFLGDFLIYARDITQIVPRIQDILSKLDVIVGQFTKIFMPLCLIFEYGSYTPHRTNWYKKNYGLGQHRYLEPIWPNLLPTPSSRRYHPPLPAYLLKNTPSTDYINTIPTLKIIVIHSNNVRIQ